MAQFGRPSPGQPDRRSRDTAAW